MDNTLVVNDNSIIITFDVGGHIYRISKHLLSCYPDSMLYMTVIDLETSNDHNEPIYINRNGNRFQYVIEYMRDHDHHSNSSIFYLPPVTVNRKAFFDDLDYYGIPYQNHDIHFPKEIMYIDGIQYHNIVWDVSYASSGLLFEDNSHVLKTDCGDNDDDCGVARYVMGSLGFSTGIHYWNIEIVDINSAFIMIGVFDHLVLNHNSGTTMNPRTRMENGIGYTGFDGTLCNRDSSECIAYGPSYGQGDVIGTLLNMNRKTITFYKNGIRIGIAANSDCITGDGQEYYPYVSLVGRNGQKISSVSHDIFSSS